MPGRLIPMTDEEFQLMRDLIYELTGISFTIKQRYSLQTKLNKLLEEKRMRFYKDYYRFLKFDRRKEDEYKKLFDAVTVNETYFYRELPQIKVFQNEILKELKEIKKNQKKLKIWSAASSTGEEPYTLAMSIQESGLFDSSWNIEVFGSDISGEVLATARKGIYSEISFRTIEQNLKSKYFSKMDNGKYKIDDNIKKMVSFMQINLINQPMIRRLAPIDVIFCRNVLIYFDLDSKKKVANTLYDVLAPHGYLFISQTESLFKISNSFHLKTSNGALMYRK